MTSKDLISRQAAINKVDSETVSTNPEHFKSSEKFIKFMNDDDIASFGEWQWSNGFNAALVATKIQLEKLPSAEPERKKGHWEDVPHKSVEHGEVIVDEKTVRCSVCRHAEKGWNKGMNFCPNCGADMRGEQE